MIAVSPPPKSSHRFEFPIHLPNDSKKIKVQPTGANQQIVLGTSWMIRVREKSPGGRSLGSSISISTGFFAAGGGRGGGPVDTASE